MKWLETWTFPKTYKWPKVHEKTLGIISDWENTHQNYNVQHLHPGMEILKQKSKM